MPPKPISDKGSTQTRRYQSDLRRQRAEQTRQRVISAAAELFAAEGYARTTLAKIASAAGVSTETVALQGPKAALMVAALEYATFGVAGEEKFLNLDMGRKFLEIDDRDEALDYLVANQTELHARGANLTQALTQAAASDPELGQYLDKLSTGITAQNRRIATVCRNRGWLRDDVPFGELVATSTVLAGMDVFLFLTRRQRWSLPRYRKWLRRMITETILAPQ